MHVREYMESDLAEIERLHKESKLAYDLPEMRDFFSKRVIEDESGIGMVSLMRRTAEGFMLCNPNWRTPAWRMEALRRLHEEARRDAIREGVKEVNSFLPPEIEKRFGKRLLRLGWKHYLGEEWRAYSIEV